MNKITFYLCAYLLMMTNVEAGTLKLLEIPLNDNEGFFTYSVEQLKECSFDGVKEINVPSFEQAQTKNILLTKLSFIQKKLNLEIDDQEITDDRITFSLVGSTNIMFEFFFKKNRSKSSCTLEKVIHMNEKKYNMDQIDIEYTDILGSPVIKRVIIKDESKLDSDVYIYPWQMRGQVSMYEFSIGPALNIHSNIRYNNRNNFERTDPAIQPIPAFFFRYGPFFANKNGVGSLLFHKGNLSVLGMGLLEGEPYKSPGLHEREQGVFAGSIVKYNMLEFTYYKDFVNDKGYNLKLNIAPEFYHKLSWKFTPQVFVQYWDNKYVDYYFGVKPEEATSGLRPYSTTHTMNYGGMFEVMHFVKRWTFITSAGVKIYGKEVHQSPTVVKPSELRFIVSALYKVF